MNLSAKLKKLEKTLKVGKKPVDKITFKYMRIVFEQSPFSEDRRQEIINEFAKDKNLSLEQAAKTFSQMEINIKKSMEMYLL
jgi:hypothetical protein